MSDFPAQTLLCIPQQSGDNPTEVLSIMSYHWVLVSWFCSGVKLTWLRRYKRLHKCFHKSRVRLETLQVEPRREIGWIFFEVDQVLMFLIHQKWSVFTSLFGHFLALQFIAFTVLINQVDLTYQHNRAMKSYQRSKTVTCVELWNRNMHVPCNPVYMWPSTALLSLGSAILFPADRQLLPTLVHLITVAICQHAGWQPLMVLLLTDFRNRKSTIQQTKNALGTCREK